MKGHEPRVSTRVSTPGTVHPRRRALVRHILKNNVPAPSCIPPAGLEVLTRRHVNDALSELHPRRGLEVLKGRPIALEADPSLRLRKYSAYNSACL
jgi:hypothetical protein